MFLKDHLKVVFKKASLENNILVKENIINKWVHRFGIDALDDLLIQMLNSEEENTEEENQELELVSDEENTEEENQELVLVSEEENSEENLNEMKIKLKERKDQVFDSNFNINKIESNDINEDTYKIKLPLPEINNLRKWINKDKKAS